MEIGNEISQKIRVSSFDRSTLYFMFDLGLKCVILVCNSKHMLSVFILVASYVPRHLVTLFYCIHG